MAFATALVAALLNLILVLHQAESYSLKSRTLPDPQREPSSCNKVVCVDDENPPFVATNSRRSALLSMAGALGLGSLPVSAAVTEETSTFANTWWNGDPGTSPFRDGESSTGVVAGSTAAASATPSDEVEIKVKKEDISQSKGLGLELSDVEFRTNLRVVIKSVEPGSLAEKLGIQKSWVLVSVNGKSAERTNSEGVAIMVYRAIKSTPDGEALTLRFRDPAIFQEKLKDLSNAKEVTTQVAPAGDTTQRTASGSIRTGTVTEQTDQKVTVTQLIAPKMCNRGAAIDDLLEISYIGRVVETGAIFDGSAVKINGQGIPGRGDDVSLYFVLGKQPFGQFPPGWDVGMVGMCVGERRRIIIPPVLAYGSTGLPKRGIPPDATLQYDVTLVSLNGLSTPQ